ncbi:MAG: hypothetical protein M1836_003092 [Candelina mexicana]|nr:MAG: hypothetical protein M1836_003092 [Candelina mexicana]
MVIFIRAVAALKVEYNTSGANNLVTSTGLYWSMIESGLGLIAACLPTVYTLFKHGWVGHAKKFCKPRKESMSFEIRIVPDSARTAVINSHALKEMQPIEQHVDQIFVKKVIDQTEDMA